MTKNEFLEILRTNLKGLPEDEIKDILYDYNEHFLIGISKGRTEEEIATSLGNPKQLAKEIKANYHIIKVESGYSLRNLFQAVFASVGLGFFNLVFVVGPFLGIIGALIGLFVAGIVIIVSGGVFFFLTLTNSTLIAIPNITAGIFLSLALISFGILWTIGTIYLCKLFYQITIMYLRFNLNIITNRRNRHD